MRAPMFNSKGNEGNKISLADATLPVVSSAEAETGLRTTLAGRLAERGLKQEWMLADKTTHELMAMECGYLLEMDTSRLLPIPQARLKDIFAQVLVEEERHKKNTWPATFRNVAIALAVLGVCAEGVPFLMIAGAMGAMVSGFCALCASDDKNREHRSKLIDISFAAQAALPPPSARP